MPVPDWWCEKLAALYDLAVADAREILMLTEDPSCWQLAAVPGMRTLRIPTGPKLPGATAKIFLAEPFTSIPEHEHEGDERVLVFRGSYEEADGRNIESGDLVLWTRGTRHSVRVGAKGCLCAVLVSASAEGRDCPSR